MRHSSLTKHSVNCLRMQKRCLVNVKGAQAGNFPYVAQRTQQMAVIARVKSVRADGMCALSQFLFVYSVGYSAKVGGKPDEVTGRANPSSVTLTATGTHALQSSPHYTTTCRHSLYGTGRVVIDPGSRIWLASVEKESQETHGDPVNSESLWSWNHVTDPSARDKEDRMLEISIKRCMLYGKSLLTDPKSCKVILIEHPLLPLYIKDTFAKDLLGNLQVPSVSFASSHLLSLLCVGRITGLVIDCGHLESTTLPVRNVSLTISSD
ncbi:hypothetical protein JVT61DRAFT_12331 [Boletus reticuloceps]|uniref:Uncharacterized protein n=1 Tax=Boletus reticuloceps TaxID=495285 RepID=A0A8I2YE37_9AGAM|nr:hypothetical protein JVT61DRAFT_12331 [Boletus reticuloceps]